MFSFSTKKSIVFSTIFTSCFSGDLKNELQSFNLLVCLLSLVAKFDTTGKRAVFSFSTKSFVVSTPIFTFSSCFFYGNSKNEYLSSYYSFRHLVHTLTHRSHFHHCYHPSIASALSHSNELVWWYSCSLFLFMYNFSALLHKKQCGILVRPCQQQWLVVCWSVIFYIHLFGTIPTVKVQIFLAQLIHNLMG